MLLVANGDTVAQPVLFGSPRYISSASGYNGWVVSFHSAATGAKVSISGSVRVNWVYVRNPS